MNDEYVSPDELEEGGQRNVIMIAVVALVLLCCICGIIAGGWFFGDQLLETLGFG